MIDIKRAVSARRVVSFSHYCNGELWYMTEHGDRFPVPVSEAGTATFNNTEKAILFMRYMRKWNAAIKEGRVDVD